MATGDIGSYSFISFLYLLSSYSARLCRCAGDSGSVPDYYHFGLHSKEGSGVICWVNFSNFRGYSEFVFGSKVSCEGYSFLCTINSNTAFLFACLNIYFCDRRIHFRFPFASIEVQSFFYLQWIIDYCHLLQVLFCGIRSEIAIDGVEVSILKACEQESIWVFAEESCYCLFCEILQ